MPGSESKVPMRTLITSGSSWLCDQSAPPQFEQKSFAKPSGGRHAWISSSPDTTRSEPGAIRAVAVGRRRPRYVAGPPKRFAQACGAAIALAAIAFAFTEHETVAWGLTGVLVVFASLEAFAGICVGCRLFALGIRAGLVPEATC